MRCGKQHRRDVYGYFLRLMVLLSAALLSGCGGTYTAVDGRDNSVFFPSLRAGYPLFDRYDRHGQSDHAVEAEVSQGRGAGHQLIRSFDSMSLDGTTLQGPADVRQDFTLDVAQVALRFRFPRESLFFVELLAGYRYTDLDLRLRSGGLSAESYFRDAGFIAGIGAGSRVSDRLTLDLRLVPDIKNRNRQMLSGEISASYWLSPYTAITGGYRRWVYSRDTDSGSDIESLVWQGFSAGLAFSF